MKIKLNCEIEDFVETHIFQAAWTDSSSLPGGALLLAEPSSRSLLSSFSQFFFSFPENHTHLSLHQIQDEKCPILNSRYSGARVKNTSRDYSVLMDGYRTNIEFDVPL